MIKNLEFFDLFSGIGGFRLGLKEHECVVSCEIDKYARQIYAKNFGKEPEYKDVRELDVSILPEFDMLTAGFPCQAFSIAGKRMGFDDTRGTLFFEIARIAKEKRPKILFLENVKGLLNHDSGRTFGTIINTLYELGYDVEWQIINGKYFVPQERQRIFIIGHLREKPTAKIFPIETNNEFDDKHSNTTSGKIMIMLAHSQNFMKERIKLVNESWTLDTSGSKMGIMEGETIRKFTPIEYERLMGFPDNWTEGVSDTQRYKLLGNSVIVPVIEFIATSLSTVN